MRSAMLVATALLFLGAAASNAQTGALVGTIVRDSVGHEVAGAEVVLPDLRRSATANYLGEFKFTNLPAGRLAVVIRQVGFSPLFDTVQVTAGATVQREFVLSEAVVRLDSVKVSAPAGKRYINPGLQEFEERRAAGFGHFITEDVLRKGEGSTLVNIIVGHTPGLKSVPGGRYVASTRKCGNGPVILGCGRVTSFCPATLYVDGVLVYDSAVDPDMRYVPDLTRMQLTDFAAIEFYAGPATTPARYNKSGAGCGTLLLWTREK